jgi:predicted RNA-binding protein with PIN domain
MPDLTWNYHPVVALVRILVDGFSLLHRWPEMGRGKARHSAAARDALILKLRSYRDAIGTPISVVFDGAGPVPNIGIEVASTPEFEIIYSKSGQTADDIIERVAARLTAYGEVLVVTNDFAERDTIHSAGASSISCEHFIQMIQDRLGELEKEIERYNRGEGQRYKKSK